MYEHLAQENISPGPNRGPRRIKNVPTPIEVLSKPLGFWGVVPFTDTLSSRTAMDSVRLQPADYSITPTISSFNACVRG